MMSAGMAEVRVTEVDALVAAGAALLDVREGFEWDAGHAASAEHLPMGELALDRLPEGRPLLVICHVGGRSAAATQALLRAGVDAANVAAAWTRGPAPGCRSLPTRGSRAWSFEPGLGSDSGRLVDRRQRCLYQRVGEALGAVAAGIKVDGVSTALAHRRRSPRGTAVTWLAGEALMEDEVGRDGEGRGVAEVPASAGGSSPCRRRAGGSAARPGSRRTGWAFAARRRWARPGAGVPGVAGRRGGDDDGGADGGRQIGQISEVRPVVVQQVRQRVRDVGVDAPGGCSAVAAEGEDHHGGVGGGQRRVEIAACPVARGGAEPVGDTDLDPAVGLVP